jgi:hypothetical protein
MYSEGSVSSMHKGNGASSSYKISLSEQSLATGIILIYYTGRHIKSPSKHIQDTFKTSLKDKLISVV